MFFRSLHYACKVWLSQILNKENCCKICNAALKFNAPDLSDFALKIIKGNLPTVGLQMEFGLLLKDYPDLLIKVKKEKDEEEPASKKSKVQEESSS